MARRKRHNPTKPTMNITPLIDVVLQLIIFFMLVNNIIAEESVKMIVPAVDEPVAREVGDERRIVVNVSPGPFRMDERRAAPLTFAGEPEAVMIAGQWFEADDVEAMTAALRTLREERGEVEVLLRADAAMYYESVRPVMQAIAGAGIERVNLVAYLEDLGAAR